jgi:glutathione S-transferase
MSLEIYWGSGSGPAWRVLLAAVAKGIPHTSHLISFQARDHKTPEFLGRNPRGKVPCIVHNGFCLRESIAILSYFEAAFPDTPKLFGHTAHETGLIWQGVMEHESYLGPHNSAVTRPIFFGHDALPDLTEAIETLTTEVRALDAILREQPYLQGESITAHDIMVYPTLQSLQRALTRPRAEGLVHELLPYADKLPGIAAWNDRIAELPGFDATYPPHWRS